MLPSKCPALALPWPPPRPAPVWGWAGHKLQRVPELPVEAWSPAANQGCHAGWSVKALPKLSGLAAFQMELTRQPLGTLVVPLSWRGRTPGTLMHSCHPALCLSQSLGWGDWACRAGRSWEQSGHYSAPAAVSPAPCTVDDKYTIGHWEAQRTPLRHRPQRVLV